jgi:hypothetical protein
MPNHTEGASMIVDHGKSPSDPVGFIAIYIVALGGALFFIKLAIQVVRLVFG